MTGALLAGVVAVILRVFLNTTLLSPVDLLRTDMYNIGQAKFEELHEMVRQDWWAVSGKPLYCPPTTSQAYPNEVITINGKTFLRSYTVNPVLTGTPDQDYRRVTMTVTEQP